LGKIKISDKVEPYYPTAGGIDNIEEVRQRIRKQRER